MRIRAVKESLAAALAVCLLAPGPAVGQSMPDDIKRRLLEAGFGSSNLSLDIYTPLLAAAPKEGVKVTKDVSYGALAKQKLDIYQPAGATNAPVFVYVHGGGYRNGDRDVNAEIYGNVPYYFARHGMLSINATYRLFPVATWPSGADDMRALVGWIKANARKHGGNADRIFMMGHSAGATHVATYAFDSRFQPGGGHGLSGVILVSGRYRLNSDPDDPSLDTIRDYFGSDPAAYPSRSVINQVPGSSIPAMLVVTEHDQRNLVATTGELFVALCQRDDGRCPRFVQLKYHNHLSEIHHINTADDYLGREILEFINEGADRQRKYIAAR
jgi:acetyl esterase/lipase